MHQIAALEHMGIKFNEQPIQMRALVATTARNRRVQRNELLQDTSLAIRGLEQMPKQCHMPNYRCCIRTAVLLERCRNAMLARRLPLLAEKRCHRKRGSEHGRKRVAVLDME